MPDVMPAIPQRHRDFRMTSPQLQETRAVALSKFRTAPAPSISPERAWFSQDASTIASQLTKRE